MEKRGQNNSREKYTELFLKPWAWKGGGRIIQEKIHRIIPQVLGMERRARIISMEWQSSVTCEKITQIATKIVGMKDFLKCVILRNCFKNDTVPSWVHKKTLSKFFESEIMSSEEASGISTVLLMDPGLVFWNSFKTVTVPSWVQKTQCQKFWSLKSWVLKKHLGYQPFCSWTQVLSSETASKPLLFHLEFKKHSVKIFGVWNHEFWRSI